MTLEPLESAVAVAVAVTVTRRLLECKKMKLKQTLS
jgi:hypothetical protein